MSIYETIDLSAERYDQHETHDDVEFILSVIGEQPKRVLEIGCGYGRMVKGGQLKYVFLRLYENKTT